MVTALKYLLRSSHLSNRDFEEKYRENFNIISKKLPTATYVLAAFLITSGLVNPGLFAVAVGGTIKAFYELFA